jgi:hypothetical protein
LIIDSSIFIGYVYSNSDDTTYLFPEREAQIWVDNSNLKTVTDSIGFYYLMTIPGTYTIKCQRIYNSEPELIEEIKNIKINKNEKIQINFYLGTVSE